jgi:hypothetical protein
MVKATFFAGTIQFEVTAQLFILSACVLGGPDKTVGLVSAHSLFLPIGAAVRLLVKALGYNTSQASAFFKINARICVLAHRWEIGDRLDCAFRSTKSPRAFVKTNQERAVFLCLLSNIGLRWPTI